MSRYFGVHRWARAARTSQSGGLHAPKVAMAAVTTSIRAFRGRQVRRDLHRTSRNANSNDRLHAPRQTRMEPREHSSTVSHSGPGWPTRGSGRVPRRSTGERPDLAADNPGRASDFWHGTRCGPAGCARHVCRGGEVDAGVHDGCATPASVKRLALLDGANARAPYRPAKGHDRRRHRPGDTLESATVRQRWSFAHPDSAIEGRSHAASIE